ncbi:MAG: CoA transferase, partial [Rhodobacteraceae bacterium]|nr:CoA transferase [Paracoccaceae bacterium]
HWSRAYACSDGAWISVQCLEPKFYATFLAQLGLQAAPELAQQYDPAQWPAQTAFLAAVFRSQPQAHWVALFAGSDACVAPVLSPDQARDDPHIRARDIWQDDLPAPAPRFAGWAAETREPPTRGADTPAILQDLSERGFT